jgi:hypothetical protein
MNNQPIFNENKLDENSKDLINGPLFKLMSNLNTIKSKIT